MAFLDFLRTKAAAAEDSPTARATSILATLNALHEKRAAEEAIIAAHSRRREELLLLTDVPETVILKHDLERDTAELRLERLEAFERQLEADLRKAQGEIAEREWRVAADRRHAAAVDHSEKVSAAVDSLAKLRTAQSELWHAGQRIGVRVNTFSDGPTILDPEHHQTFLKNVEADRDRELARRDKLDG
jgi:hypothetical protein